MKAILTLLLFAALVVGATWIINQKLRQTVAGHDQRIAQLEQRPRFISRTVAVDGIATTANSNRSIWMVEGTDTIYFAQLYIETFGTQAVHKLVLLTPSGPRKSAVIDRGDASSCTLTFWLDKNQVMLAPAVCSAGPADDHATIEAAAEIR